MLNIRGLNFAFGEKIIFNDLDLQVLAGEHVVIVGDSGGGKSTLLNLIADQHASVVLEDRASTAMVLQEGALLDHLNVVDNLKLIARYNKHRSPPTPINNLLEQLNIDSSLHSAAVTQLSGGQYRRVAIARALLTQPDMMLFDEPDSGLDIANLVSLAKVINTLTIEQNKACLSVSHNPFYIASVANKVYRLQGGRLKKIADWPVLPANEQQLQERQSSLQHELRIVFERQSRASGAKTRRDWPVVSWAKGLMTTVVSLIHVPRSSRDEVYIGAYTIYLSLITGIAFFALVGLMLGATTMAVVRMLSDNALSGWVSLFVKPESLVSMMGGRYVLYLAPSIGGMLFAARSGSIMSNWLGEMTRSRQVRALNLLGVPTSQYLVAPTTIALFISMCIAVSWFAFCVWVGGVAATYQLFDLSNTRDVMTLSAYDLKQSLILLKTAIYSALVALTTVSLGLAQKTTTHQVSVHTTKTIIYATLCIAFAELLIVLT